MGTPIFAVPILKSLYQNGFPISTVYTQPPQRSHRGQKMNKSPIQNMSEILNLNYRTPKILNVKNEYDFLKKLEADLAIVVAYGQIIPKEFLKLTKKGFINIHASILPKYRGAAPIQRAIENGEKETGISFMKLTEGLDEGPIYKNIVINIENKDYFEVESMLLEESLRSVCDVIKAVTKNLQPKEQDHSLATLANKITKNEGQIDWTNRGRKIMSKFLAFKKWPKVFFKFGGMDVEAVNLHIHSNDIGRPGEISEFNEESLKIYCGDGVVALTSVKFPGKKVIGSKDFFNSKRDIISQGDLLI